MHSDSSEAGRLLKCQQQHICLGQSEAESLTAGRQWLCLSTTVKMSAVSDIFSLQVLPGFPFKLKFCNDYLHVRALLKTCDLEIYTCNVSYYNVPCIKEWTSMSVLLDITGSDSCRL